MSSAAASSSSASMPSMNGLAHVVAELDEHVTFDLGLDEVPDDFALRGRQRFDEQFAISAGCMAATMRAAPRHEPSRNAPRSAARRRSFVGVREASISGRSVEGADKEMGACPLFHLRVGDASSPLSVCGAKRLT